MSTTAETLLDAILTAVRSIDGSGDYANDLTDKVVEGAPPADGALLTLPCAFVDVGELHFGTGPELGRWEHTLTVELYGFVAGDGDTPGKRVRAALGMLSDFLIALRAERSLGGYVLDVEVDGRALEGQGWGHTSVGVAVATVTVKWWVDSGGGT